MNARWHIKNLGGIRQNYERSAKQSKSIWWSNDFVSRRFSSYITSDPWVSVTMAWRVPWVADGGVGLQIWRLAANILNKKSWTADQEWSSILEIWREANNLTL